MSEQQEQFLAYDFLENILSNRKDFPKFCIGLLEYKIFMPYFVKSFGYIKTYTHLTDKS